MVHTGNDWRGERGWGWRTRAKVVAGGLGPGRPDPRAHDADRARTSLPGPARVVFLGCTGGAGQTAVTALTARTLAALRSERVSVVDLNTGQGSLSDQLRETIRDGVPRGIALITPRREPAEPGGDSTAGSDTGAGNDGTTGTKRAADAGATPDAGSTPDAEAAPVPGSAAADSKPDSADPPGTPATSGSESTPGRPIAPVSVAEIESLIGDRHQLTCLDPAASAVARVLPLADLLVLIAPASEDAARAVAMTQEWLDAHGFGELSARAVTVINGVSTRSLPVTEQAEAVARGRCHAIVRVPWDRRLSGPGAAGTDPRELRQQTRDAYGALAGVIVNALAVTDVQEQQEEGRALR